MDDAMQARWQGRWDQLTERARQVWGLTDDDLDVPEGDLDGLIGRIEQRTGESARNVQARLDEGIGN